MLVNKPIRILQIIGNVSHGGVEMVIFNYYRHINTDEIQFDFVIDEDSQDSIPQDITERGARVYPIPSYKHIFSYIHNIRKIVSERNYNIVHSNMNTMSVFSLFAAALGGAKVRICHSHSTAHKGEGFKNTLKYILRPFSKLFATDYFACSEVAGRWLFGDKTFEKKQVTVIANAVDTEAFGFSEKVRDKVRANLNIERNFVIGHIGRFMYQKNHSFLIDIFNEVKKQKENSVLVLVGDGELRQETENKVAGLNLKDSVLFLGKRDDVSELLQAFDCFVLPSFYEGLPLVAVEAQYARLPIILSNNITQEVKINTAIQYIDLEESPEIWANEILNSNTYKNEFTDYYKFDINQQVKILEKKYLKLEERYSVLEKI